MCLDLQTGNDQLSHGQILIHCYDPLFFLIQILREEDSIFVNYLNLEMFAWGKCLGNYVGLINKINIINECANGFNPQWCPIVLLYMYNNVTVLELF